MIKNILLFYFIVTYIFECFYGDLEKIIPIITMMATVSIPVVLFLINHKNNKEKEKKEKENIISSCKIYLKDIFRFIVDKVPFLINNEEIRTYDWQYFEFELFRKNITNNIRYFDNKEQEQIIGFIDIFNKNTRERRYDNKKMVWTRIIKQDGLIKIFNAFSCLQEIFKLKDMYVQICGNIEKENLSFIKNFKNILFLKKKEFKYKIFEEDKEVNSGSIKIIRQSNYSFKDFYNQYKDILQNFRIQYDYNAKISLSISDEAEYYVTHNNKIKKGNKHEN